MNFISGSRRLAAMARIAFFAVAVPCVALAVRIEVPPSAVSPFADTEVTTNISFGAANGHVRYLELAFALDGCASNCVQVAFGHDANGDGVLGFAETDTLYGWRNGRYFAESVRDGVRIEEPAADAGTASCAFAIDMRLTKDLAPLAFSATNGLGAAILTNLSASAHGWLYRPEWDTMRVTRRGPGIPAEWFACDIASHFMYMNFR
jgi:hypothetical protein